MDDAAKILSEASWHRVLRPTGQAHVSYCRATAPQYKLKFNIVDEPIDLYRCGSTKPADRIRILRTSSLSVSQLKAIEVDQREGEKIHVNITFPDDTTKKIVDVEKTINEFKANL